MQEDHRQRVTRRFRWTALVFGVALVVHAADHFRRGMDVLQPAVMMAGWFQIALSAVTLVLVFTKSRWAAHAAIVVGFGSAIGFVASHLLPHWGCFSDSFINAPTSAGVTVFSWFAALFEIAADAAFGVAGIMVLKAQNQ